MIEIEPPKENGEQQIGKQNKLLTTKFLIEIGNQKVEGLISHSTEQQIIKFKVNSGNNQELWGVNTDFSSNELKWTIDAILQHMGFYHTTENPYIMMRVNHKTKSCEYIIIYHDELYIELTTIEGIIHIVQNTKSRSIHRFIKDLIFLISRRHIDLLKEIYGKVIYQ